MRPQKMCPNCRVIREGDYCFRCEALLIPAQTISSGAIRYRSKPDFKKAENNFSINPINIIKRLISRIFKIK